MAPKPADLKQVHFRARTVAAEHGLLKISDLHHHLAGFGLHLSESQLGKLLRRTPRQLNLDVLAALCAAFRVTPNDLLELRPATKGIDATTQQKKEPAEHKDPREAEMVLFNGLKPPRIPPLPERAGNG